MSTNPQDVFMMAKDVKSPVGVIATADTQLINTLPVREIGSWDTATEEREPAVIRQMQELNLKEKILDMAEQIDGKENLFAYPTVGFVRPAPLNPMTSVDGAFMKTQPDEPIEGFAKVLWDKEQYLHSMPVTRFLAQYEFDKEKKNELALAYPASMLFEELLDGGTYVPDVENVFEHPVFVRRSWCETDTDFLQLIPYVVFHRKNSEGKTEVFVYQRTKLVGEDRLAGNYSIGVGGHINMGAMYNPVVTNLEVPERINGLVMNGFWETLHQGVMKELNEEILLVREAGPEHDAGPRSVDDLLSVDKLMGNTKFFIDYSGDDTNKVHLGAIIGIELAPHIGVKTIEDELQDRGFVEVNALLDEHEDLVALKEKGLESWSESIVRSLVASEELFEQLILHVGLTDMCNAVDRTEVTKAINLYISEMDFEDRWLVSGLAAAIDPRYDFLGTNILLKV